MANIFYNIITFPDKQSYLSFITQYGKGSRKFSYEWIIPEPATQEECEEQYIVKGDGKEEHIELDEDKPWFNWYEWHCDKWGCKWDAMNYDGTDNCDDEKLTISFDSPWNPPMAIYKKMAELGLEFSFFWMMEGDAGGGEGTSENGKIEYKLIDPPMENNTNFKITIKPLLDGNRLPEDIPF